VLVIEIDEVYIVILQLGFKVNSIEIIAVLIAREEDCHWVICAIKVVELLSVQLKKVVACVVFVLFE
jgi:acetolactate synthase regulatory subunit